MLENMNATQDALSGTGYKCLLICCDVEVARATNNIILLYIYMCQVISNYHNACFASAVQRTQSAHPNLLCIFTDFFCNRQ